MELFIYEVNEGYGFKIESNGQILFIQETDVQGSLSTMTKERAIEFGNEVLGRLQ